LKNLEYIIILIFNLFKYNNLTKTNQLPDYSRKDAGLDFTSKSGEKGKFIVLKRKQYEI
jgi:hypothetical protein